VLSDYFSIIVLPLHIWSEILPLHVESEVPPLHAKFE